MAYASTRLSPALRRFVASEAAGGLVLIVVTAGTVLVANSPLAGAYHHAVGARVGGLAVEAWVNDVLMAVFFLLVGLEIKREFLHGQLRGWPARTLPILAAVGGMAVPAVIFAAFNWHHPERLQGWAIPSATDIAFALGVLSLLGPRVPPSLKIFLTALAVLDDLGAVVIIALFYTGGLAWPPIGLAACVVAGLLVLNRTGVRRLWPYLVLGAVLWGLVWRSGVHATIAGVVLALTIPAGRKEPTGSEDAPPPLHRLEHALEPWAAFLILPVFAFVNAGVSIGSDWLQALTNPVSLGVALGLSVGKQGGVLASLWLAVRLRLASRPVGASWAQLYGVALLCGIGFTMSLFIGLLAYEGRPELLYATKVGVLAGSVLSAVVGAAVLWLFPGRGEPEAVDL